MLSIQSPRRGVGLQLIAPHPKAQSLRGARRQAQNWRGASRHAAKGTAEGDPAACPGSLVHMNNYLVTYLPTEPPHPSHLLTSLLPDVSPYLLFLLLPLVLPPFPRRRPHCSTKRGREGTPLAQQNVDAKARRSLNKTFLYKDERRSLNKTRRRRLGLSSTTHRLRKGPPDEARSPQSRQMMPRRVDLSHFKNLDLGTRS